MKSRKTQVLLIVLVTVLFVVTGWTSANQTKPSRSWEYKVVLGQTVNGPENEQIMNKAGSEGWELVGSETIKDSFQSVYYFKRPK